MPAGTIYTCPMHPEVRQVGPGSCPKCGMALEPEIISLDDKPDPELIDMTRRFWIALALTVPVFVIEMGGASGRPASVVAAAVELAVSSRWRRRWCCGRAGRSSCAAGVRCLRAISTCSR